MARLGIAHIKARIISVLVQYYHSCTQNIGALVIAGSIGPNQIILIIEENGEIKINPCVFQCLHFRCIYKEGCFFNSLCLTECITVNVRTNLDAIGFGVDHILIEIRINAVSAIGPVNRTDNCKLYSAVSNLFPINIPLRRRDINSFGRRQLLATSFFVKIVVFAVNGIKTISIQLSRIGIRIVLFTRNHKPALRHLSGIRIEMILFPIKCLKATCNYTRLAVCIILTSVFLGEPALYHFAVVDTEIVILTVKPDKTCLHCSGLQVKEIRLSIDGLHTFCNHTAIQ